MVNKEDMEKIKKKAEEYLKEKGLTDQFDYIATPMGIVFIPKGSKKKYFDSFGDA